MQKKKTSRSKHLDFLILDIICVELAFLLAYYIRMNHEGWVPGDYKMMNVIVLMAHLTVVFWNECYSGILRRGLLSELKNIIIHNCYILGIVLTIFFFIKLSSDYSRVLVGLFIGLDVIFMMLIRNLLKILIFKQNKTTKRKKNIIIIANTDNIDNIAKDLTGLNYGAYAILGAIIMDEDKTGEDVCGVPVVANIDNMYDYVKENVVDEVFIESDSHDVSKITNTFLTMGVVVHVSLNNFISNVPNVVLENINNYTVVTTSINLMSFKQKVLKRTIDICAAIPGIIIMGLLFVIFAPIIYIQSPGPIFFKQVRIGKNGRRFRMYKFRSMYMDAEERKKELMEKNKMSGLMFKMDDDPRITPIGKFMRKTSIDEFPQFINILKGDMSLVGTRPPTEDEYNQYELHHKSRLAIKPGLTGMWQVSGRSDITDFEEVVRLDNEYIRKFSISLDIRILFKTVGTVLFRKGSV
ncbi:MAG: sugar transferase [Lachnospiraceae bacterium]|nr:sugar transferase [Lachnospiraceae bacterium]